MARLRVSRGEIKRRFTVGGRIRPRRQLSGPPLPPELPVVADALAAGTLGEDHLRVIGKAMDRLPSCVSPEDRAEVEASLVREGTKHDAAFVKIVGRKIDEIFNPDGDFDEQDRARRRGMVLGPQGPDGMSRLYGWIDPETRSYVEASTAAVRPGRHLPDGTLAETADDRSPAQRCHDGLKLGLKAGIASGGLGSHRGHPVTVIVRTTLAELNQAAHAVHNPDIAMPGPARTGGDTALPMRDLIRMATDAIHYLAVFENHSDRPLYLGRQQRIASVDQRIICYSRDGGLHPTRLCGTGVSQRGAPQPTLGRRRCHRRRCAVLRVRAGPRPGHRRSSADHRHRTRPPGLERRHHTTTDQPRPPPRRTPPRRPRPARLGGRHLGAVVELEHDRALQHDLEVDGVGGVHAGIGLVEVAQ